MAVDLERLVVQLDADVRKYENALRRAQGATNNTARQIETRFQKMNRTASAGLSRIGARVGAGLVAGFSVQKAGQLLDAATRIQNALKVAGLEGAELEKVYGRLVDVALKHGAPLEALATLYGRLALVQKDLGVSSDELVRFMDNVAAALKVAGTDASAARGALTQLSQALGGGVVRAEEFNSMLEATPTIVQAVARGIKEAGGSVAKLRQLVNDGKVASEAWFRGFQAGSGELQEQAKQSATTIGQAFENIDTALTNAATQFDKATDASGRTAGALDGLAQVIELLGNAFSSLSTGPIGQFLRSLDAIEGKAGAVIDILKQLPLFSGIGAIGMPEHVKGLFTESTDNSSVYERIKELMVQRDAKLADGIKGAAHILDEKIRELEAELTFQSGGPSTRGGRRGTGGAAVAPISIKDHPVEKAADKVEQSLNSFVDQVVKAESGGDTRAKNPLSSATGLGQFIESTWLKLFRENFPDRAASMSRETILALRTDADTSRTLIEAYARENAAILQKAGVSVDEAALHLAHFLGPGGAVSVLQAAPGTKAADVLSPGAVKANQSILGDGATVEDVIAYAQARAGLNTVLTQEAEIRTRNRQIVADMIAQGQEETARIQLETSLVGASNAEREKEIFIFEKLNELKRQGIELTPALLAQIEQEASLRFQSVEAYDAATAAADRLTVAKENLNAVQDEIAGAFQGAIKGLISDLVHGKDATEALLNAVSRLADRLLDIALDQLFASILGGGLGGGGLKLFAGGGYTGQGGKFEPAGIVHRGEYVMPKEAVQRLGVGTLDAIRTARLPGFAGGGLVMPRLSRSAGASPVSVAAPAVNVHLKNVNAFDSGSFLSEALSTATGQKAVLNMVRAQPGAFKQALGG